MNEMLKTPPKESIILWPWEIKGPIEGPAVMFDVLAASYNIIHLSQKARRLFTVTKDSVLDALVRYPDAALIGETDNPALLAKLKDKFISTNSPSSIVGTDVLGRDVILITNNGTHTISELIDYRANPVIVGHWVNIDAVANFIRANDYGRVYLIPSGGREKIFERVGGKLMEDWYCAESLRDRIAGKSVDFEQAFQKSRAFIHYVDPKGEHAVPLILQANTTTVIPHCFSVASGIIEVKA